MAVKTLPWFTWASLATQSMLCYVRKVKNSQAHHCARYPTRPRDIHLEKEAGSSFCCDASWRGSGGLSGPHSALEAFIGILICRRDTQQGVVSTRAHARVPIWLRVRVASALTPTYVPWTYVYVRPRDVRMSLGRTSHGRASHGRALALAYPPI